jgi:fatty acid-binding protein DegV
VSIHGGSGVVEEASKQRTRKRAFQWLRDTVFEEPSVEHLSVCHGEAPDVEELVDLLASRYPRADINIGVIGPVIGTHGGPRVVGVTFQLPR